MLVRPGAGRAPSGPLRGPCEGAGRFGPDWHDWQRSATVGPMTTNTDTNSTPNTPDPEWSVIYPDGTFRPIGTREDALAKARQLDDDTDPDGEGSADHLVMVTTLAADLFTRRPDHYANGYAAGSAAGSWVVDGNTDPATARAILDGIDDGDPETLDMMPAPLSGEWAGESMPELLGDDCDDPDAADDYESGYLDGYWETVERAARYLLSDDDD